MRDMVLTVDEQADTIEKLQRVKAELEELIAEKDAYAHDLHDEIDDLKRLMQDDAEAFRTRVQAMQAEFRRRLTSADLETKSEVTPLARTRPQPFTCSRWTKNEQSGRINWSKPSQTSNFHDNI